MKCRLCGYPTNNKQRMVLHLVKNHPSNIQQLCTARRYSSVDIYEDGVMENLALGSLHIFVDEEEK